MVKKTNGHGGPGHNSGPRWMGRILNVIDRDPEIKRMETLFDKEKITEGDLAVLSGLSASTVANMFSKEKTRRPQHTSFTKMAGALGFKYELVRDAKPNYADEIPKAREQFKEYREFQAKKRERQEKRNGKGSR
jgi:transcriptional regulator with XRE-family HTH domain